MSRHNIVQLFIDAAGQTPQAIALIKDDRQISYADLLADVKATAAMYRASGIQKGDRLLVFVPMSIDLYRIVLALFYIGAVPVFLDAWVKPSRLLECLKTVPCKGLVAPRKLLWLAWLIAPLRGIEKKFAAEKSIAAYTAVPVCEVAADNTALVTFTTGSTGTPKAANRTHRFLSAQLAALSPLLPAGAPVTLTMLPIVVLIQLALSRTTVLPPKRYKSKKAASFPYLYNAMRSNGVALFITSPAAASQLCLREALPAITHIITGGGPVPADLALRLSAKYPGADLLALYGSTEAEPIAHLDMRYWQGFSAKNGLADGLALGLIDAHAAVAIIPIIDGPVRKMESLEWEALQLPDNAVGEIVVSGPHVLQHYINNPAAERLNKISVAGEIWHRTGDAGRLGHDGMLYFYGRCTEVIVHRGTRLYPLLVDDYLRRNTGADYSALLLHKGRLLLVIEKSECYLEALLAKHLQAIGLEDVQVIYQKALPKDPRHQSKIDYARLRAML